MPVYIDASALTPLIVVEAATDWAQATILSATEVRMVSDFAIAEVSSAISRLVRMQLINAAAAEALLDRFDDWVESNAVVVATTSTDVMAAARLVRRFELKLRTPDALHLVLARRSEAALITLDRQMSLAAQALGLVIAPLPT